MNTGTRNKISAAFIIACLTGLLVLMHGIHLYAEDYGVKKVRIAVFPFYEVKTAAFNMNIAAILRGEFSAYRFIETVPVEVIQREIYEIEPSYLLIKRKDTGDSGGIIWNMEPGIIEEVEKTVMEPFDMTAGIFESQNDWENALSLRYKAEKLFPYNIEQHRRALGRDYYFYALSLEKKGDRKKAQEQYKGSLMYLDPSSENYSHARDVRDSLTEKKASGN